ncbi:MAG TPA: TlpA disulfide reductase family protein [Solirubrobacteraceae bacterium]
MAKLSHTGRRVPAWVLVGVLVGLVLVFGLSGKGASVGRPAPALPRELLAGPPITLTALRSAAGGRAALVVFWASWCGPCQHEAPAIERLARSATGRGRVVGVDWSDEAGSARRFIAKYGWSFSNLRDGEGAVGLAYGLRGLPTTFVIGADGRISRTLLGPQTERMLGQALGGAS